MKASVTGGRDYHLSANDIEWLAITLKEKDVAILIHGDCRGVDREAAAVARAIGIDPDPHPAKWKEIGKRSAGPIRNQEMINIADLLIAFPGEEGTADCIAKAQKKGIPIIYRYEVENENT